MVNAEKHRAKVNGGYAPEEKVRDLELGIIKVLNDNPEEVIKELKYNNNEFSKLYDKMTSKEGSVIASTECKKILDYSFRLDFTNETITNNYHGLKLASDVIADIKYECERGLAIIEDIRELQNKNIDDPKYYGMASVLATEMLNYKADNIADIFTDKELEDILRLTYKKANF